MADFRKWIFALAVVALLAGFTVPASAQIAPFSCNANAGVPPIVRAEGYTEAVGDLILNCTGGASTEKNQPVPQVNFQIFLNTNVTSRILTAFTSGPQFNEALLIIDEPNGGASNTNPSKLNNPILNCAAAGAPDTGPSGPGVCLIISDGSAAHTYDGTPNAHGIGTDGFTRLVCGDGLTFPPSGTADPNTGTYGCGRPNVFQGRQAIAGANGGVTNSIVWLGVPLDPPGTVFNRTIRITNVRANAVGLGISSTFTTSQIQMNISVSGNTSLSINNPQQIVAYVQKGLITSVSNARLDFVQCNDENPDLFLSTTASPNTKFTVPAFRGDNSKCDSIKALSPGCSSQDPEGYNMAGGYNPNNNFAFPISSSLATSASVVVDSTPTFRSQEGFASSWKVKNIADTLGNSTYSPLTGAYTYNGGLTRYVDQNQNVPGAIYETETGFEYDGAFANPSTNPPNGVGVNPGGAANAAPFSNGGNSSSTNIKNAGKADHATRLALNITNVPTGAAVFMAPIIFLYRQGSSTKTTTNGDPTLFVSGFSTGVMVLTSTDVNGGGSYAPPSNIPGSAAGAQPNLPLVALSASGLAVYEILYTDPFSLEQADVPVVVAWKTDLNSNLPQTGINTQVAGGFAPFYATASSSSASTFGSTPDVPRFIPASTPATLFTISRCACNLLFPYVASAAGFDTGIAIANTSQDPGSAYGFLARPQAGTIQFWYYGTIAATGASAPPSQTSASVPAGQVLTYVLSNGGGSIGNAANGLDNRAAGFVGYIIAQAGFQYCHAYAFISALGAGPTTNGTSEGYLGIVLDKGTPLVRTNQNGENDAH